MRKQHILEKVSLEKFVHGGQALGATPEGRRIFVWGGLSGEVVDVQITKKKNSYMEGVVTKVRTPSKDRIEPLEPISYLSTSPWQIMAYKAENKAKQLILEEAFVREGVKDISWSKFVAGVQELGYRNKQEFGFWGDDEGLHLAHYVRGTKTRQVVDGSALAKDCINEAARAIRDELRRVNVWGGKLKTVTVRASQGGETVAALFMKEELDMSDFRLPKALKGLDIYYSSPKSPASVPTNKLYSFGDISLTDSISGINITYDVMSFFQVNLEVFELALEKIKEYIQGEASIDFYSGVGTIGLVAGSETLIESDEVNIKKAVKNAEGTNTKVVHASSENALEFMVEDKILIVDPPRAGLHKDIIERINEVKCPKVVYLSCNPSTQARDVNLLAKSYKIIYAQGFNFFPRTPHIESLVVLELK